MWCTAGMQTRASSLTKPQFQPIRALLQRILRQISWQAGIRRSPHKGRERHKRSRRQGLLARRLEQRRVQRQSHAAQAL